MFTILGKLFCILVLDWLVTACAGSPTLTQNKEERVPDKAAISLEPSHQSNSDPDPDSDPDQKVDSRGQSADIKREDVDQIKSDSGKPVNLPNEPAKPETASTTLERIFDRISKAPAMKVQLTKKTKLKLLNREEEMKGMIFVKKVKGEPRLRLEFEEPQRTVTVLRANRSWMIEYPPEGIDDVVRVSRFSSGVRANEVLVNSFLKERALLNSYKVAKEKKVKQKVFIELSLAKKNSDSDLDTLNLILDEKSDSLISVAYTDRLGNNVSYEFYKYNFDSDLKDKLFELEIPKGAEISDF